MISQNLRYRFVDRGFKESVLLLPGWATDWRIFDRLNIPFNYVFAEDTGRFKIEEIASGLHLLGWSMGGFFGARLAADYPRAFKSLTFVSVRRKYPSEEIDKISVFLRRSPRAYLQRFYAELFSGAEDDNRLWFESALLKDYLDRLRPEDLVKGLDYLRENTFYRDGLAGQDVTIVHGADDAIAPIEEARQIAQDIPGAKFVKIPGARHLPFMREEFISVIASSEATKQ